MFEFELSSLACYKVKSRLPFTRDIESLNRMTVRIRVPNESRIIPRLLLSFVGISVGIAMTKSDKWDYQRRAYANKMFLITLDASEHAAAIEKRFISIMSRAHRA